MAGASQGPSGCPEQGNKNFFGQGHPNKPLCIEKPFCTFLLPIGSLLKDTWERIFLSPSHLPFCLTQAVSCLSAKQLLQDKNCMNQFPNHLLKL